MTYMPRTEDLQLPRHAAIALHSRWQEPRTTRIAEGLADDQRAALIDRAETCARGFEELGRQMSADVTWSYAEALRAGMPTALYAYQVQAQERRLIDKKDLDERYVNNEI